MLICGIDVAGKDNRPNGGLPEVQVTGVAVSESAVLAVDPATTPLSTPAVAHAAQGPAPAPITRDDPPVSMSGEAPTPPSAASSPAHAFGFEPAGAAMHAGMLLSQLCVFASGHAVSRVSCI